VGCDFTSWLLPSLLYYNFRKQIIVKLVGEETITAFSPQFTFQFLKMQVPIATCTKHGIQ